MSDIVCPTLDSVLHSPSGQHPVGTQFDCTGPTTMHCDAGDHDATSPYSEEAAIDCSPLTETLNVVPEPSLTLMLVFGLLTVVMISFLRRKR
jgi:hypothetical protein